MTFNRICCFLQLYLQILKYLQILNFLKNIINVLLFEPKLLLDVLSVNLPGDLMVQKLAKIFSFFLIFILLISLTDVTFATPIPYTENEKLELSDLIVKGIVVGYTDPKWNTEDGETPPDNELHGFDVFYDVVVEVKEVYKGELPDDSNKIYIRQIVMTIVIDGTAEDSFRAAEEPHLKEGDKFIFCLMKNENSTTSDFGPQSYWVLKPLEEWPEEKAEEETKEQNKAGDDVKEKSGIFQSLFSFIRSLIPF
ncbi:hypothetical protein MmiAt1_10100 [Methanimicrococcus sp. At1]|uniref:Uncharacterized protein n=1 Tax=Methanimicrococcus hacksteinii TaxID=3028293 RepID=A0ABU3VPT3_9EURY|nr:hypothetical protein [Methanimicrococcus sp. At1]MDV0445432.1 hypothetical protein [Methanimicrococcus sp. At1]